MQWFVVHTLTGHEQKVKKILKKTIKEKLLEKSFGRIIIPVENLVQIKKGKKVIEEKRLYPGYIVIEMEGTDENLRLVNSICRIHFYFPCGSTNLEPYWRTTEFSGLARLYSDFSYTSQ